MLTRITGILLEKFPGQVLLELGPVVVEVLVPLSLYEKLPIPGQEISLYVVLRLKGESLELYGFTELEDRALFQRLQGLPRVGPRLALNILSVFSPEQFREVIAAGDVQRLSQVPGIGPKRAARLCVELRSRLDWTSPQTQIGPLEEALSALLNLGFSRKEALESLKACYKEGMDLALLLRQALKRLSEGVKP